LIKSIREYISLNSLPPILFLHGLSLGTNTYILFIRRLTSLDRTIILLDIPDVSMRLRTEILPMSTILSSIEQLLISLNEKNVISIGHSFGTLIQSCIIKQLPHLLYDQVVLFIDPVCFLIFDSRYTNNFIYRKPRTPNQLLLYTSCTEDLYSIYAVKRHLCWYECNLWVEDIQQSHIRVHVFFSENDDIIPVSFVNEYLKKSNINTTVFPHFKHGQFLISSKFQDDVLKILHQLEAKPACENNNSIDI
jgi:pimeloyl-ACP methyl ester carboxylesterase